MASSAKQPEVKRPSRRDVQMHGEEGKGTEIILVVLVKPLTPLCRAIPKPSTPVTGQSDKCKLVISKN